MGVGLMGSPSLNLKDAGEMGKLYYVVDCEVSSCESPL